MNDRIQRLESEAARLNVASARSHDRLYQGAAALAMVGGVIGGFVAYQASLTSDDPRDIQSLTILAITMLALAVVGSAVFLRYSLGRYLRFWLLRQLYEGQSHIDQLVAAFGPSAATDGDLSSGSAALDADHRGDHNGGTRDEPHKGVGQATEPGAKDG
jgi:hypothetical protein